METWFEALKAYLDEHRDEMVEDLFSLVRIPSIAKAGEDGLPFGAMSDKALVAVAEM